MTKKSTRRTFLTSSVPVVGLAAPVRASQTPAQPPRKQVYRKITPTSKTVNGQPLYSPELSFGNLVFVSGKGPGANFQGDIKAQTKNVLKVNVYLTDIANFAGMNEAYIGRFGGDPPVRTTVAVTAIPDGTLVEIDCIASI
jgi:2-iminobutanoate/2-iminopropanoate deaminase